MPQSVYSIRAETALRTHLADIDKLLTVKTRTPKLAEALRNHIEIARSAVLDSYDHAQRAGHLNDQFEDAHGRRLQAVGDVAARWKSS